MVCKILIDGRKIDDFGVGTHLKGFFSQIGEGKFEEFNFEIILKKRRKEIHLKQYIFPYGEYNPFSILFFGFFTRFINYNTIYVPFFNLSPLSKNPVITVHDLIHFKFPKIYSKKFGYNFFKKYFKYSVKKAKKIFVVSETTKKDLIEYFPETKDKIVKIPNSTDPLFYKDYNFKKENYFCFIGNNKPHKNLNILLNVWEEFSKLHPDYYLYLICPIDIEMKNVKVFKNLKEEELIEILGKAKALLSPSIYEGFNLPILEAVILKTIPVVSFIPVNIELLGEDYPLFFDPKIKESLFMKLENLSKNYENFSNILDKLNIIKENNPENLSCKILEMMKSFS